MLLFAKNPSKTLSIHRKKLSFDLTTGFLARGPPICFVRPAHIFRRLVVAAVVHVDGVKICLRTAASNGPVVHPPRWYMSTESHSVVTLGGGNRWSRRKTCHSAIFYCTPQIPHGLTRSRTRASAVRYRRLTAWAMARHFWDLLCYTAS
jgi:hypothetical protein